MNESFLNLENCETDASLNIEDENKFDEMLGSSTLRHHFIERLTLRTKDLTDCPVSFDKWRKLTKCASTLLSSKNHSQSFDK